MAFNSFDPTTGIEQLYVSAAGLARIYAVKPVNDRWLGRLPQNQFEVSDMQTEFWMEASYREQFRLIQIIKRPAGRPPAAGRRSRA